jgi:hypothetical protein
VSTRTRRVVAIALMIALAIPCATAAQTADVWRTFAQKLDVGSDIRVHLANGQRFRATLIDAREDRLVVQPKTRVPVSVQSIDYDAILSIERAKNGTGAAKAAAIGVGTGVASFFAIMLIMLAAYSD